eukprot:g56662.t1
MLAQPLTNFLKFIKTRKHNNQTILQCADSQHPKDVFTFTLETNLNKNIIEFFSDLYSRKKRMIVVVSRRCLSTDISTSCLVGASQLYFYLLFLH